MILVLNYIMGRFAAHLHSSITAQYRPNAKSTSSFCPKERFLRPSPWNLSSKDRAFRAEGTGNYTNSDASHSALDNAGLFSWSFSHFSVDKDIGFFMEASHSSSLFHPVLTSLYIHR